ncbi:hypothetical protein LTR62_000030 [Meristemomyces frigidus]|uniref:Uncharacterized protein n=1 Tax=Meristemomyces frigidus TaxID=1508187 RepID=A0AAN7TXD6_9PEZI|nr:hypothetical protein LTR62_000030 [Meristemomyces frigidus]
MALSSRELPLPTVPSISSLSQAHATLLHCWNRLLRSDRAPLPQGPLTGQTTQIAEGMQQFRDWLQKWERGFSEFLTIEFDTMDTAALTQCRVLKANHLACIIMVSDPETRPDQSAAMAIEFRAIVELAEAVLQARITSPTPSASNATPVDANLVTSGLDVYGPLQVVLAQCTVMELWSRAHQLYKMNRVNLS